MSKRLLVASSLFTLAALCSPFLCAAEVSEHAHREALEHYRAGQALLYAEDLAKAEQEFRAAIKLDPLLVLAHYSLGQVYMGTKQYPEAVRAFIGCRQAYLDVSTQQASSNVRTDLRHDEEIQELRDSVRTIRSGVLKLAQPEITILRLENRINDLENAKRRAATTAGEVPAEFSLALGSAYFRSGAPQDAQREYEAALKVNPRFGEAHNNLAVLLMLQGRLPEASEHLKSAEKAGFHVNPQFKADLESKLKTR
jgi:tetratricopeptide (TPR) repeat protein